MNALSKHALYFTLLASGAPLAIAQGDEEKREAVPPQTAAAPVIVEAVPTLSLERQEWDELVAATEDEGVNARLSVERYIQFLRTRGAGLEALDYTEVALHIAELQEKELRDLPGALQVSRSARAALERRPNLPAASPELLWLLGHEARLLVLSGRAVEGEALLARHQKALLVLEGSPAVEWIKELWKGARLGADVEVEGVLRRVSVVSESLRKRTDFRPPSPLNLPVSPGGAAASVPQITLPGLRGMNAATVALPQSISPVAALSPEPLNSVSVPPVPSALPPTVGTVTVGNVAVGNAGIGNADVATVGGGNLGVGTVGPLDQSPLPRTGMASVNALGVRIPEANTRNTSTPNVVIPPPVSQGSMLDSLAIGQNPASRVPQEVERVDSVVAKQAGAAGSTSAPVVLPDSRFLYLSAWLARGEKAKMTLVSSSSSGHDKRDIGFCAARQVTAQEWQESALSAEDLRQTIAGEVPTRSALAAALLCRFAPDVALQDKGRIWGEGVLTAAWWDEEGDRRCVEVYEWLLYHQRQSFLMAVAGKRKAADSTQPWIHPLANLAYFYSKKENWPKAAQTWERAKEFSISPRWLADTFVESARAWSKAGDTAKAKAAYDQVPQYGQSYFTGMALYDQALSLLSQNDPKSARAMIERDLPMLRGSESRLGPLWTLALAHWQLEDWEKAELALKEVLKDRKAHDKHNTTVVYAAAENHLRTLQEWKTKTFELPMKNLVGMRDENGVFHAKLYIHSWKTPSLQVKFKDVEAEVLSFTQQSQRRTESGVLVSIYHLTYSAMAHPKRLTAQVVVSDTPQSAQSLELRASSENGV